MGIWCFLFSYLMAHLHYCRISKQFFILKFKISGNYHVLFVLFITAKHFLSEIDYYFTEIPGK